jgi:hypothetical protein
MTRYCPACRESYEDWVERCPDCGRGLTTEPPPDDGPAPASVDDPVVLLTTEPNEPLAQLTAQVLADEGIRTLLRPVGIGYGGWGSVATIAHRVFVLRSQRERARQVLAELNGGAAVLPGEGED